MDSDLGKKGFRKRFGNGFGHAGPPSSGRYAHNLTAVHIHATDTVKVQHNGIVDQGHKLTENCYNTKGVQDIGHFACERDFSVFRNHTYTQGLPKYLKMFVTGIGHLHEYGYRCQNT